MSPEMEEIPQTSAGQRVDSNTSCTYAQAIPTDGANCRDTNLWRPNNGVGLARERSLTIIFVESGLERPALGHRALFRVELLGAQTGKSFGLDIQAL